MFAAVLESGNADRLLIDVVVVDGDPWGVLASLQRVVALTPLAGFSVASDGNPWRDRFGLVLLLSARLVFNISLSGHCAERVRHVAFFCIVFIYYIYGWLAGREYQSEFFWQDGPPFWGALEKTTVRQDRWELKRDPENNKQVFDMSERLNRHAACRPLSGSLLPFLWKQHVRVLTENRVILSLCRDVKHEWLRRKMLKQMIKKKWHLLF